MMTVPHVRMFCLALLMGGVVGLAQAKLPAPSDEAKAAAAAAADKAGWSNKVAAYQLCKAQDRVAAQVLAQARSAGKTMQPTATPACADPGPYQAVQVKAVEAAGAHAPAATAVNPPVVKPVEAAAPVAKKP